MSDKPDDELFVAFDAAKARAIEAAFDAMRRKKGGHSLKEFKPWARCPSTHCERRQECASPHECTVTMQRECILDPTALEAARIKFLEIFGDPSAVPADYGLEVAATIRAYFAALETQ